MDLYEFKASLVYKANPNQPNIHSRLVSKKEKRAPTASQQGEREGKPELSWEARGRCFLSLLWSLRGVHIYEYVCKTFIYLRTWPSLLEFSKIIKSGM